MTIVEFLLARIAEDEFVAQAAAALTDAWDVVGVPADAEVRPGALARARGSADLVGLSVTASGPNALPVLSHAARHDPCRVLAECQAKRAILVVFEQAQGHEGAVGFVRGSVVGVVMRPILEAMASVYADHPAYDQDWAL